MRTTRTLGLAALLSLGLAACDEASSPLGHEEVPEGEASFGIVLATAEANGAAGFRAPGALTVNAAARGRRGGAIPLSALESIVLPVGRVEAKQGPGGGGSWLEAGFVGADIDILNLPLEGLPIIETSLPEGEYSKLRVYLTAEPTVTLLEDVKVGRSTFEAGTHPLVIPSVEESGFKVKADFTVGADGQVLTIVVDPDATVKGVKATGAGVLKIAPVLDVRADGETVGEFDDEPEAEDPARVEFEGWAALLEGSTLTLDDGTVVEIGAETTLAGDLLTLEAVAEALANEEEVEVEGEGVLADDGTTLLAHEIEFEVEDDDGDGETDDDDGEVEVEGPVTAVDPGAGSFTVRDGDADIVVVLADGAEIEGDFETLEAMAAAFEAGEEIDAEAEGTLQDDGSLLAWEVELESTADHEEAELEGRVAHATSAPPYVITLVLDDASEVTVRVNGGTKFSGDLTSYADLLTALDGGALVDAEVDGKVAGPHVLAKKIELEIAG